MREANSENKLYSIKFECMYVYLHANQDNYKTNGIIDETIEKDQCTYFVQYIIIINAYPLSSIFCYCYSKPKR